MAASPGGMVEIWRELRERFPLLDRIAVHSFEKDLAENIPHFFGLFLAVLDDKEGPPCCFVLPRRGQMARIASIVFGLSAFRREFDSLARDYANQTFDQGERVRIHPSGHVFSFGGFWPDEPTNFRLNTLDGTGSRTFPANAVLRLEPTQRVNPRGRLDTKILATEPTELDEILGVQIFGNLGLFKNRVLCLDEQSRFANFAADHGFRSAAIESVTSLGELLPFGKIRDGVQGSPPTFENWSARHPRAEPLVAVTSSAERLAAMCLQSPIRSKIVVLNGLRGISNLQAFDDIVSCQRVVLFADHDDEERMQELEARGCRFWIFGDREFFSHGTGDAHSHEGPFGHIVHRAVNLALLQIQPETCASEAMDAISLHLEQLSPEVDEEARTNPDGGLGRIAQRLWRLLTEISAVCGQLTDIDRERFANDLSRLGDDLRRGAAWFKPETAEKIREILSRFAAEIAPGSELGMRKGIALCSVIRNSASIPTANVAVLTRSESHATATRTFLAMAGHSNPVFSLAGLPDDASFERVIVTSWPGGDAFRRLVGKLVTPDIVAVAYGFETRWLGQCQRRLAKRSTLTTFTGKEKAAFIDRGSQRHTWPDDEDEPPPVTPAPGAGFDVWSFEQQLKSIRKCGRAEEYLGATMPAKYVSFVGESYAFLTQWHKVPVATKLLERRQGGGLRALPEREIADLKPGDLIVFPEGGQKAVIAQIADRQIGQDAAAIRKRSRMWREVLQGSNMLPEEFLAHAKSLGYSRHILTIRNWFNDEAQIGPGNREDLDLISVVADSSELGKSADDVWDAISFLRSQHTGAGSVLRDAVLEQLRGALSQIEENGSRIEVPNLGAAWVVQIDAIAATFTDEPRNQVDRLLRDEH